MQLGALLPAVAAMRDSTLRSSTGASTGEWRVGVRSAATIPIAAGQELRFSNMRLRRLGANASESRSGLDRGTGILHLLLQIGGSSTAISSSRRAQLAQGDWLVCVGERPPKLESAGDADQLVLTMPRSVLQRCDLAATDFVHVLAEASGIGRLVGCFVQSMARTVTAIDRTRHADLAGAAAQLIKIALAEHLPRSTRVSLAETTSARVKQQILKNLRDPELSLEGLAEAIGCTKRCLHKAFEYEEHTLSEFIWNSRLDQCREEILDSKNLHCPLTAIAFSWGFNSAAHFSRVFRARFSISPSQMRKRAHLHEARLFGPSADLAIPVLASRETFPGGNQKLHRRRVHSLLDKQAIGFFANISSCEVQ
jgi:AraC family transcriptional activator of tynA and feaB